MVSSVDVAVVGAGITGLAAAHSLPAGLSVAVIEADPRPGGKVRSASLTGIPVECGPDTSVVGTARRPPMNLRVFELCMGGSTPPGPPNFEFRSAYGSNHVYDTHTRMTLLRIQK